MVNSTVTHTGYVDVYMFDSPIRDTEDLLNRIQAGDFSDRKTFKNKLTNHAVASMASVITGANVKLPKKIKLGTGSSVDGPLVTDTDLWTPDATTLRTCSFIYVFQSTSSEFGVTYDTNEINGVQYTEAGLYDEDGKMWAHVETDIFKTLATPRTAVVLWKIAHEGV